MAEDAAGGVRASSGRSSGRKVPTQELVESLMKRVAGKDKYLLFTEPVKKADVPDYYDVIKQPMFLATMQDKVARKAYRSVAQFRDDFNLVIRNAQTYNPPDNPYHQEAAKLERACIDAINAAIARDAGVDDVSEQQGMPPRPVLEYGPLDPVLAVDPGSATGPGGARVAPSPFLPRPEAMQDLDLDTLREFPFVAAPRSYGPRSNASPSFAALYPAPGDQNIHEQWTKQRVDDYLASMQHFFSPAPGSKLAKQLEDTVNALLNGPAGSLPSQHHNSSSSSSSSVNVTPDAARAGASGGVIPGVSSGASVAGPVADQLRHNTQLINEIAAVLASEQGLAPPASASERDARLRAMQGPVRLIKALSHARSLNQLSPEQIQIFEQQSRQLHAALAVLAGQAAPSIVTRGVVASATAPQGGSSSSSSAGAAMHRCFNCGTTSSRSWHAGPATPDGRASQLCEACGSYWASEQASASAAPASQLWSADAVLGGAQAQAQAAAAAAAAAQASHAHHGAEPRRM